MPQHVFTRIKGVLLPWLCLICGLTLPAAANSMPEALVIHFPTNQWRVTDTDKARLRQHFDGFRPQDGEKILVVGYSDSRGDGVANAHLSDRRAQSVRQAVLAVSGIPADIVLAMGRGEEKPVGDNRRQEGRALNRRAEVYLARMVDGTVAGHGYKTTPDLDREAVVPLVDEAMKLLRARRLPEALRVLHQAVAHGAEHHGGWHTAYGIAAYYAGIDTEEAKAHLIRALRLEPFDSLARDYLGRLEARTSVAQGRVTSEMGRQAETPIPVFAAAQVHEYLMLFGVQPLSRHRQVDRPVDKWRCRDARGQDVAYYFDHSQTHAWAFGRQSDTLTTADPLEALGTAPWSHGPAPEETKGRTSADPPAAGTQSIWDSRVFR